MNAVYAYLIFVLMYSLIIVGLFVVLRKEFKKLEKELKGERK